MAHVAIVGAGIAGLHLGFYLRKHGVDVTLFSEKTPEQLRSSQIMNTVVLSPQTRARERELGISFWDVPGKGIIGAEVNVSGPQPLSFVGDLSDPVSAVDMRIYLSRLIEELALRGADVRIATIEASDLAELTRQFNLVVVASGRRGLTQLFPKIPSRSPYADAQRQLCAGFFRGLPTPAQSRMSFNISPGHGEIFNAVYDSFDGMVGALMFEAIPGQGFQALSELKYAQEPERFNQTALEVLRVHAPTLYARVDKQAFGLARPLDVLQGSVTPVVRRGYADVGGGRYVVAIGDAYITNDPITGQGANLASRCAWETGKAILASPRLDERFCRLLEHHLWDAARSIVEWTNAMLRPPPPHVLELFVAASMCKPIADAFVDNFYAPELQWRILADPEVTRAFVEQKLQTHAPVALSALT